VPEALVALFELELVRRQRRRIDAAGFEQPEETGHALPPSRAEAGADDLLAHADPPVEPRNLHGLAAAEAGDRDSPSRR
jgi:hypothetical protein